MKDFDKWNILKKVTHSNGGRPFFREREIWFCKLGANVGYEQDGVGDVFLRPVLVVRKFNREVCWIVPLTRTRKNTEHYFHFVFGDDRKNSVAILSQIRLLDVRRFSHKIGEMQKEDFRMLTKKIKALLP